MTNDLYVDIIKKQQELINLMSKALITDDQTIQAVNMAGTVVNDMQEVVLSGDEQNIKCDLNGKELTCRTNTNFPIISD